MPSYCNWEQELESKLGSRFTEINRKHTAVALNFSYALTINVLQEQRNEKYLCKWPCLWTKNVKSITILNSPRHVFCIVTSMSNSTGGNASLLRVHQEIIHWSQERHRSLLLHNLLTVIKHTHKSLSSCYWLLLVQLSVLKHLNANLIRPRPKPLSQLWHHHDPLRLRLRLRLRFLSFFKGSLLLNFHKMVQCLILIIVVQQFEDVSNNVRMNLPACVCGQTT
jgi:hypothetical protein